MKPVLERKIYLFPLLSGITQAGGFKVQIEVHINIEKLDPMLTGEKNKRNAKQIFEKKPGICWNISLWRRYFDYGGKKGCGLLTTIRCYHLPGGLPGVFVHKK